MTHDYGGHHQPTVKDGYHDQSHNIRRFDDNRSDVLSNVGGASGMGYGTNTPAPYTARRGHINQRGPPEQ